MVAFTIYGITGTCTMQNIYGWSVNTIRVGTPAADTAILNALISLDTARGQNLKDNKVLFITLTQEQVNKFHDIITRAGFQKVFVGKVTALTRHPEAGDLSVYCAQPDVMHKACRDEIERLKPKPASPIEKEKRAAARAGFPERILMRDLQEKGVVRSWHTLSNSIRHSVSADNLLKHYGIKKDDLVNLRELYDLQREYIKWRKGETNAIDGD